MLIRLINLRRAKKSDMTDIRRIEIEKKEKIKKSHAVLVVISVKLYVFMIMKL